MNSKWDLSCQQLILISVPIVCQLVFVLTLSMLLSQAEYEIAVENHSKLTLSVAVSAVTRLFNCPTAIGMYALCGDPYYLKNYYFAAEESPREILALKALVKNRPVQLKVVNHLEELANELFVKLAKDKNLVDKGKRAEIINQFRKHKYRRLLNAVGRDLDEIRREEFKIIEHSNFAGVRDKLRWLVLAGAILAIPLYVFLSKLFSSLITKRLFVLSENALRLVRREPLKAPISGNDEIAQLDRVFHQMADSLAAAARKESAVVGNVAEVICSIDKKGKFTFVNPASNKLWGYPPHELLGQDGINLVYPEDREKTLVAFDTCFKGQPNVSFENRVIKRDGSSIDMLWSAHWSDIEKSLFCVVQDISASKKLERLKKEFLETVSHDLKTPLNSVLNLLTLMSENVYGPLTEKGRKVVIGMEHEVNRLIRLISDLLDIEKMEAGKLELYCENVLLSSILERSFEAVRGIAGSKHITIELPSVDLKLYVDEERIIQVLVNLLSNAIRFSSNRSKVTVSVDTTSAATTIRVKDEGCGIPADKRETIFERFKRIDWHHKEDRAGSGLGLAICKMIIERHNGVIGVDSAEGKGSMFWFSIPKRIMRNAVPELLHTRYQN